MHAKVRIFFNQIANVFTREIDPEIEELRHDIEALDQFLHIQNLRRAEEERFRAFMMEVRG